MANKYKSSIDRAKIYVSELVNRKETFDLINSNFDKIWQIEKKYLLSPISSGLVFVNQHRAHFRILFDQFNDAFNNKPIPGQILLFPVKINIDSHKKITLSLCANPKSGVAESINNTSLIRLVRFRANASSISPPLSVVFRIV